MVRDTIFDSDVYFYFIEMELTQYRGRGRYFFVVVTL